MIAMRNNLYLIIFLPTGMHVRIYPPSSVNQMYSQIPDPVAGTGLIFDQGIVLINAIK